MSKGPLYSLRSLYSFNFAHHPAPMRRRKSAGKGVNYPIHAAAASPIAATQSDTTFQRNAGVGGVGGGDYSDMNYRKVGPRLLSQQGKNASVVVKQV